MSIAPPPWTWPLRLGFTRRDTNGTLILTHGRSAEELQPQSNWRLRLGKLCLKLDLLAAPSSESATAWIAANRLQIAALLNQGMASNTLLNTTL